jgi:hypothetical protein
METAPLEDFVPPRGVLPFREQVTSALPIVRDEPPCPVPAAPQPRGRRRRRIALIAAGLFLYAAGLVAILAPSSWWP